MHVNLNLHAIKIKNMKLPKNVSLLTLLSLVLISLIIIVYPWFIKPTGVIVAFMGENSPCKDIINIGSTITGIGNKVIKNSNEFVEAIKNLEGIVTFIINNNPRSCNIPKDAQLNVSVTNVKSGGIKLGVDIWGGTYYLFKTQKFSDVLFNDIKQRVIKYGLSNTEIELYNDTFIRILTSSDEESYVNLLIEPGKLEGKIIQTINFDGKSAEFTFDDKTYEMFLKDEKSITINKSNYEIGQYFKLDDVDAVIENISKNTTTISFTMFDGMDLILIQDPRLGSSRIAKQGSGYVFAVPVKLSDKASENFEKTTKNLEVLVNPTTGESYSKFPISILIDDKPFITIPILSTDMGVKTENLILWGYYPKIEDATKSMVRLKTIVEMKSLPQELTLVKRDVFKTNYWKDLITSFLFVILIVSAITSILFFVKFRKNGMVSLPLILMGLSIVLMIFGVISLHWFALIIFFAGVASILLKGDIHDWKGWVGVVLFFILIAGSAMNEWILNIPLILGLVAVIPICFTQCIFVGMRILKKKESYDTSEQKITSKKLWIFSTIFVSILMILYFIGGIFTGFVMVVSIGLWINLSLIIPNCTDITKKFIK